MSTWYEHTYGVSARDTGLFGQCRPSGILTMLQEAAASAACEIHVSGPEMLEKYRAIWMIVRMWYRLERPVCWGDKVTIRTWHRADHGATLYRDFDIAVNGVWAGEAVSAWVLADVDSRRLLRMGALAETLESGGGDLCKDRLLAKLTLPGEMVLSDRRSFRYSDADINGHVNNVKYADAMADAIHLEKLLPGRFVSQVQLGYHTECLAGEEIALYTGRDGADWYVRGADGAGKTRFDGFLRLADLQAPGAETPS